MTLATDEERARRQRPTRPSCRAHDAPSDPGGSGTCRHGKRPVPKSALVPTSGRFGPAVVEVLNAIYEVDFLGFSYGFRPGRGPHDALDALAAAITTRKVNWVLDADIASFFDRIDHEWLVRMLEHRIADRRILRLIQEWLSAGVMENGSWMKGKEGTPQGATISPSLANIFLHYVFDLWIQRWRRQGLGEVIAARYADDFIVGFQRRDDAEEFLRPLRLRLERFSLELHPDKTRLDAHLRQDQGGRFLLLRRASRKRLQAKLQAMRIELMRRWHLPTAVQGRCGLARWCAVTSRTSPCRPTCIGCRHSVPRSSDTGDVRFGVGASGRA